MQDPISEEEEKRDMAEQAHGRQAAVLYTLLTEQKAAQLSPVAYSPQLRLISNPCTALHCDFSPHLWSHMQDADGQITL